jgi:hypothetical protein
MIFILKTHIILLNKNVCARYFNGLISLISKCSIILCSMMKALYLGQHSMAFDLCQI